MGRYRPRVGATSDRLQKTGNEFGSETGRARDQSTTGYSRIRVSQDTPLDRFFERTVSIVLGRKCLGMNLIDARLKTSHTFPRLSSLRAKGCEHTWTDSYKMQYFEGKYHRELFCEARSSDPPEMPRGGSLTIILSDSNPRSQLRL
jgi:hypothetical protein